MLGSIHLYWYLTKTPKDFYQNAPIKHGIWKKTNEAKVKWSWKEKKQQLGCHIYVLCMLYNKHILCKSVCHQQADQKGKGLGVYGKHYKMILARRQSSSMPQIRFLCGRPRVATPQQLLPPGSLWDASRIGRNTRPLYVSTADTEKIRTQYSQLVPWYQTFEVRNIL